MCQGFSLSKSKPFSTILRDRLGGIHSASHIVNVFYCNVKQSTKLQRSTEIKKQVIVNCPLLCYIPSLPLEETKTELSEAPLLLYIAQKRGNIKRLGF